MSQTVTSRASEAARRIVTNKLGLGEKLDPKVERRLLPSEIEALLVDAYQAGYQHGRNAR